MNERERLAKIAAGVLDSFARRDAFVKGPSFLGDEIARTILAAGHVRIPAEGTPEWEAMVERMARAMGDEYSCGFDGLPDDAGQPKLAVPYTHGMSQDMLLALAAAALRALREMPCKPEPGKGASDAG